VQTRADLGRDIAESGVDACCRAASRLDDRDIPPSGIRGIGQSDEILRQERIQRAGCGEVSGLSFSG
jgi:hypothetical protein